MPSGSSLRLQLRGLNSHGSGRYVACLALGFRGRGLHPVFPGRSATGRGWGWKGFPGAVVSAPLKAHRKMHLAFLGLEGRD